MLRYEFFYLSIYSRLWKRALPLCPNTTVLSPPLLCAVCLTISPTESLGSRNTPLPPPLPLSHPPPLTPSFTFPGRPGTWGKWPGQYAKAGRYGGSRPCRLALHDGTSWEAEAAGGGGEGLDELPGIGNLSLIIC
jgi:hypothetical protein